MTFVVDASVVVAYLLGEATDAERGAVLGDAHAPEFLDVEVAQVLRGLVRGSKLELARAELARAELPELGVRRYADVALLEGAWVLRDRCTTYDGLYVVLAQGLDAELVTRDGRLARGVDGVVPVRLIA